MADMDYKLREALEDTIDRRIFDMTVGMVGADESQRITLSLQKYLESNEASQPLYGLILPPGLMREVQPGYNRIVQGDAVKFYIQIPWKTHLDMGQFSSRFSGMRTNWVSIMTGKNFTRISVEYRGQIDFVTIKNALIEAVEIGNVIYMNLAKAGYLNR